MTMKILALVTDAFGGEFGIAEYNRCLLEAMAEVSEDAEVIVLPRLKQRFASEIPGRISQKDVISNKFLYVINVIKLLCLEVHLTLFFAGIFIYLQLQCLYQKFSEFLFGFNCTVLKDGRNTAFFKNLRRIV